MAAHAKDALRSPGIAQVLDLPFTVAAPKATGAEGLVAGEDGQVLDLVAAGIAVVRAVVADEGAVAEQEQVGVGVEQGVAGVAAEAVDVPAVAGQLERFAFFEDLRCVSIVVLRALARMCRSRLTSPHPLHGKITSSSLPPSMNMSGLAIAAAAAAMSGGGAGASAGRAQRRP